jgi:dolichol-phosphate mannosyltransferase
MSWIELNSVGFLRCFENAQFCESLNVNRSVSASVSVVVPTFNERENIPILVNRLDKVLAGQDWEVIFVDDNSPDGTADIVREVSRRDRRVRLIARHNRRGLSSAVIEGALAASSEVVAVMDGDLQHDETVLPRMLQIINSGEAELVSASRFLTEDGAAGLSSDTRVKISNTGNSLSNLLFRLNMTDPLTGFFMMRRDVVLRALPELSEIGFKVLIDLIVSAKPRPKVKEVAFQFRSRLHGESKLDNRVMYDFFLFFIEKKVSRYIPVPARFISFALVNSIGIMVHMAILMPAVSLAGMAFNSAQLMATVLAMLFNYSANNALTYRDRQLKGPKFYFGFLIFAALCSVGILGNIGVAAIIHDQYQSLFYVLPAMAGAFITVVWNYVATQAFVWGNNRFGRRLPRQRPTVLANMSPGSN